MAANVKKPAAIIFIFIVFSQEKDSFIPSPCDTALGFSLQPILFHLGSEQSHWGSPSMLQGFSNGSFEGSGDDSGP